MEAVSAPSTELDSFETGAGARNERKRAGLTQAAVASAMGIKAGYLCDLEYGRRNWNHKLIEKFNAAMAKLTGNK